MFNGKGYAMSVEENKAKVLRAFELVNWGIVDALRELMTPTFVGRDPTGTFDRDKYVALMAARLRAVPDAHFSIDGIVAEGDKVAVRYSYTGTVNPALWGNPGAVEEARQTRIDVFRVADGKIQEGWAEADLPRIAPELGFGNATGLKAG